jgi:FkbM family methyltransferase
MLARIKSGINRRARRWKYAPDIEVERSANLLRLGSETCGWTFEPSPDLQGSQIVSCGLGEDGSFDVEFASRFAAKVIIVDPTPCAIRHFGAINERLGQPAVQGYSSNGSQPPSSYDLSKIVKGSLLHEPSALWVENTKLKFFSPGDTDQGSHSIVNYSNNYSRETRHIEVEAITPEALFAKYRVETLPLLKLDIEGAEVNVIRYLLEKSIRPRQLLVEFDEMRVPDDRSKKSIEDTDRLLRQAGYLCAYFDGRENFLYSLPFERAQMGQLISPSKAPASAGNR